MTPIARWHKNYIAAKYMGKEFTDEKPIKSSWA